MPPNDTKELQDRIDAMFDDDRAIEQAGEVLAATLPRDLDPYGLDAFKLQSADRPREEPPVTTITAPGMTDLMVSPEAIDDYLAKNPPPAPNDDCATGHCNRPHDLPPVEPQPKALYGGVVQMPAPAHWQETINEYRAEIDLPHDKRAFDQRPHEARADLDSLDYLLAYRALLVERLAPLAAMHKHEGKWDEVRRAVRGMIAAEIRKDPPKFGFKAGKEPGVEAVTDAACADPRYVDAVRRARAEAIEYETLNHELAALDVRIRAREIANLQWNAEARL
jgi:hypothetical protein